jgi:radical SAM superfamily enzyme YgiQ (UPF0313 family)
MLTLIEPINLIGLNDRPDLGCAMLIGSCREHGIKTTLVKAQTRYIHDMFTRDSENLYQMLMELPENNDKEAQQLLKYKHFFQTKPINTFKLEVEEVYWDVIVNKSIRSFLDASKVKQFITLYNVFRIMYTHRLLVQKKTNIRLIDRYVDEVVKTSPSYLGFSIRGEMNPLSREIISRVKERIDIPVIVGGTFTPFVDHDSLQQLFESQGFDYMIIGAGDQALPALIEALEGNREPTDIPNVCYQFGNRIKVNEIEVCKDPNQLPHPDFSQFDLDLYPTPVRILPFQTARGCYWRKCAFCSHHNVDRGHYKTLQIDNVIEQLHHLKSTYDCSHFFLADESLSSSRARRLSEALINRNLNVHLDIRGRLELGFNNGNLLKLMRKAGISSIAWGLESGCQRVLDSMRKGIKLKNVTAILRKSHQAGIANMCFIICGFPGETSEEWRETVDFLMENRFHIDRVMSGTFKFSKHAPVAQTPEKWGLTIKNNGSITMKRGMTPKQAWFLHHTYMAEHDSCRIEDQKRDTFIKSGFDGHICRMIIFVLNCYVSQNPILDGPLNNKHGKLFPVLLGEPENGSTGKTIIPVDLKRTVLDNFETPEPELSMEPYELKVFELANGNTSLLEIAKQNEGTTGVNDYQEKIIQFFKQAYRHNWCVMLEKNR